MIVQRTLADLIDAPSLQSLMDDFYELVHVPMAVLDTDGQVLVGVGWQDVCTQFHRVHPDACRACIESDTQLTVGVPHGEFRLYKCKNAMWDAATPIMVGDRHVGNVFAGQFFFDDETVDVEAFRRQARRYAFDEDGYLAALHRVPRLSRQTLDRAFSFFVKLAHMLSHLGDANVTLANGVAEREALIEGRDRALAAECEQREHLRVTMESIGDGVIVTDRRGRITFLNAVAETITGWSRGEATSRPLPQVFRIINEGSREPVESPVARVLESGTIVGLANHTLLIARDGTEIPVDDSAAPVKDDDGQINGVVLVFRDGRKRREAERLLERERNLLDTVIQATDVMLVYLDRDFNFVTVNAAYAAACRMDPDEMIGKNHFALFPHAENEAIFRQVRDTGVAVFYKDKPFEFPDQPERGITYWDWSLVPVQQASGEVTGLVFSLRETTKSKRAEIERDRFVAQRQVALDAARMGWWQCDPATRIASFDQRYSEIFGVTGHERPNEEILELLHPDDLPRVWDAVEKALDPRHPQPYSIDYRVNRPDGGMRWVEAHGLAVFEGDGAARRATSFVGTVADITRRKQIEESLREANAALAAADRRKNEFIAVLSHELRNPLAPIRFALPLLHAQPLDEAGHRSLAVVARQTDHLARLVDDLLEVSRITSGRIELRREHVSLASVLMAAADAASPSITERRHTLKTTILDDTLWLHADPPRLAQVVTNLLDNSAKYTPPGGEIGLEAWRENGDAVVRVSDNGIGIPTDSLPCVFEMFRQVERPDKPQGGLGIGLAVSKRLVEMHGGTIEAHSPGIGQGSQVVVRLPLAGAGHGLGAQTPRHECTAAGGPSLRVLIVDDNADLVEMLAVVVEAAGHRVRKALDGKGALGAAVSFCPHVVFLDLGLPDLSGLEVARELRRHPETRNARLVALTGWGQEEDRRRTEEAGFECHLTKPADTKAIERVLAEAARAQQA